MARIALVCPAYYSHLRAFEALGQRLSALGHMPVYVLPEGAETMLEHASPATILLPHEPVSRVRALIGRASGITGVSGILKAVGEQAANTDRFCRLAPGLFRQEGIEAIVADELEPGAGLVASCLGLAHVSLACALPIERDPAMPLPFLDWPYDASEAGLSRNRGGELVGGLFMARQRAVIRRWSQRFGLGIRADDVACLSPALRLSQTVPGFDFPRPSDARLTPVGPVRAPATARTGADLPFAIAPDRPFVFASLGTVQGHRFDLFQTIAAACARFDVQLMIAHCGGLSRAQSERLDADWVVDFVDQQAILQRADLCVTHAGLNTVLDCLASSTPMLALPISFDQPGIGARIAHHRIGRTIAGRRVRPGNFSEALTDLLAHRADYARRIAPIRAEIESAGGTERAADLIDDLIARTVGRPIERRFDAAKTAANDSDHRPRELSAMS
ncbi:glycosyltransferase [Fulvimarina sp. 2208YS6-2-32]|uniref:Glycosyltransferase n=1 Tax=Fulvimarina uroteuthidis TaxID=3098149 RepID=A0ABU5HZL8_9HYPH|nr:glycosyltransferase [Fulvimarina sp. 2208YS6-2-32]MDY8107993.1 glycosyltransferase [Fulvimarina sp. 2208YS6-2-32]